MEYYYVWVFFVQRIIYTNVMRRFVWRNTILTITRKRLSRHTDLKKNTIRSGFFGTIRIFAIRCYTDRRFAVLPNSNNSSSNKAKPKLVENLTVALEVIELADFNLKNGDTPVETYDKLLNSWTLLNFYTTRPRLNKLLLACV